MSTPDSHVYTQLMFDKEAELIPWRKDSVFNKQCGENLDFHMHKTETFPLLYTLHKN